METFIVTKQMEIELKMDAIEYHSELADESVKKVAFYITDKTIIISAVDIKDKVVGNIQLEVTIDDFKKLSHLIVNLNDLKK